MIHSVNAKWRSNLQFDITQAGGDIKLDGLSEKEGYLKPKPLMLSSLLGCTGMDVTSLLKKMRVEIDRFELDVEAELTDQHPKYYKKVHVIYTFYGEHLNEKKILKAVDLSVNTYCGVFEMFRQFSEVSHEVKFIQK